MVANVLSEKEVESILQTYYPYFMPLSLDGAAEKVTSEFQHRAGVSLNAAEFKKLLDKTDSQFSMEIFSMVASVFLAQEFEKSKLALQSFMLDREKFSDFLKEREPSEELDLVQDDVKKVDDSSGQHHKMLEQFKIQLELYTLCFKEIAQWQEKKRLLEMQLTQQSNRHCNNFNAILQKKGFSPKFNLTQARQEKLAEDCEKFIYDRLKKKADEQKQKGEIIHEIQTSKEFQEHVALKIADHFVSIPATADERKQIMEQRMSFAKTMVVDLNERFNSGLTTQIQACDEQIENIHLRAAQLQESLIKLGPIIGEDMVKLISQCQNTSQKVDQAMNQHFRFGLGNN